MSDAREGAIPWPQTGATHYTIRTSRQRSIGIGLRTYKVGGSGSLLRSGWLSSPSTATPNKNNNNIMHGQKLKIRL